MRNTHPHAEGKLKAYIEMIPNFPRYFTRKYNTATQEIYNQISAA